MGAGADININDGKAKIMRMQHASNTLDTVAGQVYSLTHLGRGPTLSVELTLA